ncbi:hypothetical protein PFBG_02756 [Plasmodium falciparum 7G8]|uniref:Uncharacterized protein n=1 Tax=Plasmodium falciparum (isolate 7G8) TaxID=57266 RepID=W7F157_PLAF8|nr:hypothetical protein PFBG_02756 [Plasmodium falciparum 7G8]
MKSKKECSTFTFYRADENKEGKLYYISFKFACLSLYIIGFYYVLLSEVWVLKPFSLVLMVI